MIININERTEGMKFKIVILCLLISGCGLDATQIDTSLDNCKSNNGLTKIIVEPVKSTAYCNNGAMFEINK